MARDTLILIGNGFAIDYRSHAPDMPDTSRPLDFPLRTPGVDGELLRDTFSELWQHISSIRAEQPGSTDFGLMKQLLLLPKPPPPPINMLPDREAMRRSHLRELIETQLRLHLTHAYTHVTQMISPANLRTWRWSQWLLRNIDRLHMAVSFNYDLLFERSLCGALPFRYLVHIPSLYGMEPELAVFKPHGSINFEYTDNVVRFGDPNAIYRSKNVILIRDAPLRVLPDSGLDVQRINSDIVLPTEASSIRQHKYIQAGYRFLKLVRGNISRCVIIGLSYWDCDRPEIDEILGYLGRRTEVVICDPCPSSDLLSYCRMRFDAVQILPDGLPDE